MGIHIAVNKSDDFQTNESRTKTLLGRARTIARLLEPALGEEDGERFFRLEDAVSSRSELLADLRSLSCDPSSFVECDPGEFARPLIDRIRDRADAKEVEIVFRCSCDRMRVQPRSFAEAIYELLDNAVRATRRLHPVMIEVCDTSEADVLWQIQDSGEGIPERILAELGHPPRTGVRRRSGLGVALAWAVIEKHGGLLRFESAPGIGTTASVWLPGG